MEEQAKYKILEDTVRQSFVSVVWSHKIQEKQSDIYATQFRGMETIKIIAASLTSAGIISSIFVDEIWIKLVSALLSFITIFVNSFFKSFDLQSMISQHKAAANNLLGIREEVLLLLLRIKTEARQSVELSHEYEELLKRLNKVYSDAPSTSDKAVDMASISLKVNGDNTYSNKEIDRFLPEGLRKED